MPDQPVCGLDPSLTGFAICVMKRDLSFETWRFESHRLGADVRSRTDRALMLVERVMEVVDRARPRVICLEGYSFGSKDRGTLDRVEMGGILRADLATLDTELHEVAPMTLKKFVTGTGKGDKTAMIACMAKRWRVEFFDTDRYDAYALARVAGCIAGLRKPGTAAQREALDTVLHGRSRTQRVKR